MIINAKINPAIAKIDPAERHFIHLPFTSLRLKGPPKRRREVIEWWHVRSTGYQYEDEIIGAAYAVEALQFLLTPGQENSPLLSLVFAAMGKKKHTDIERGFIKTLVGYARKGAEATALDESVLKTEE